MKFLITARDGIGEEIRERRMRVRPEHLENLRSIDGSVICAGPIKDDDGKVAGSYLIMEFETREKAEDYLANEPYVREKVWEHYGLENCEVVIMNDELQ